MFYLRYSELFGRDQPAVFAWRRHTDFGRAKAPGHWVQAAGRGQDNIGGNEGPPAEMCLA